MRTALDHAAAVTRLAVLDAVPIGEALARADARFAERWWHWFFFGQTAQPAERLIDADPDAWYRLDERAMGAENHADARRAVHDPATVHAMLEDYRAGLGPDRAADDDDRAAGRRIACPVLVLWASRDDLGALYGDPLAVWRAWADDVRGGELDSGHHLAEDAPEALADELRRFLAS
jgi:haloacetate dehalogenase